MLMIVVSLWIVLPLSAGATPDQFAQNHPSSDSRKKQPSPNLQHSHHAPSASRGEPAVKSASPSTSHTRPAKSSTHVASRSTASSAKGKSSHSSTSQARSAKPSSHVTSHLTGSSGKMKGAHSSTAQTRATSKSPHGTNQGSTTSVQAKLHGNTPATSSSTPISASSGSHSTRGLDPARKHGEAPNKGVHDPKGVPGSTPNGGSTVASGKTSQSSRPSADPTKGSSSWTPSKTGGTSSGPGTAGSEAHHHPVPGVPTSPPGNMIAGGDERAIAEAAAAARTTGAEGPVKEIRDLENRAAASRQLANQFARAADDMLANFRNNNGDITKEDIDKMKTFATAGGYRSQAFLNSPPEVQSKGHQFEGRLGLLNLMQAANLAYQGTIGGDKEANKTLYQMEIKRSRMMSKILNKVAQDLQSQADSLRGSPLGSTQSSPMSTQPSPTSTESE
jgi:hypothetical protein